MKITLNEKNRINGAFFAQTNFDDSSSIHDAEERIRMGTRQSMDHFLEQCEGALRFADFEYTQASKQEHWDDLNFQKAQSYLEEVLREMDPIYASANRSTKRGTAAYESTA